MNEKFLLFYGLFEESTPTDAEYNEVDYQEIENSMYRAIKRVNLEQEVTERLNSSEDVYNSNDLVDFSTSTDANLYTVSVDVAPTTCAQQQTAILLEIRNILLIFLFSYFIILIYSKLKTTIINFTR